MTLRILHGALSLLLLASSHASAASGADFVLEQLKDTDAREAFEEAYLLERFEGDAAYISLIPTPAFARQKPQRLSAQVIGLSGDGDVTLPKVRFLDGSERVLSPFELETALQSGTAKADFLAFNPVPAAKAPHKPAHPQALTHASVRMHVERRGHYLEHLLPEQVDPKSLKVLELARNGKSTQLFPRGVGLIQLERAIAQARWSLDENALHILQNLKRQKPNYTLNDVPTSLSYQSTVELRYTDARGVTKTGQFVVKAVICTRDCYGSLKPGDAITIYPLSGPEMIRLPDKEKIQAAQKMPERWTELLKSLQLQDSK